jgi:hypothetical protein
VDALRLFIVERREVRLTLHDLGDQLRMTELEHVEQHVRVALAIALVFDALRAVGVFRDRRDRLELIFAARKTFDLGD